jgi:probable O-glycosylation ligase (exosortase A-associated)
MFFQFKQRFLLLPVLAMVAVIAMLFAPEAWRERMDPTRQDALDGSARSRLNSWTYSWRLAVDYPITGGGFEAFTPALFQRYAPNPRDVHGPHSAYFGVLAEHGFVGLGLYLTLLGSCWLSTRWVIKRGRAYDDHLAVSYALMLRFSLVGFMVSAAFLGRAYFDYFFTIVALIGVLKYTLRLEWRQLEGADADTEERIREISEVHG